MKGGYWGGGFHKVQHLWGERGMSFLTLIHPALIQHLLNGASKPHVHQTQEHRQMDNRVGVGNSRAPYAKATPGVPVRQAERLSGKKEKAGVW